MGNYIVEEDIKDYSFPKKETPKKDNKNLVIIISIGVFIVVIFILVLIFLKKNQSTYKKIENELKDKAQEYAINSNMNLSKETYIDNSKLNVSLPNNCNILSGVIYKDGNYTPYLLCDNYKSEVFTNDNDLVILNGDNIILLTKDSNYYDLGYFGSYDVQISGRVDTSIPGIYNIYYISSMSNSFALRKVIVVDNPMASNYLPVINMQDEYLEINIGEDYQDNVMAIDKNDGDISDKIIKVKNVDTRESGEYYNAFSITNSLGYTTMSAQKIVVLSKEETTIVTKLNDDNMSNSSVDILVNIIGDKYDYLILPDGTETKEKEIKYTVEENGDYNFIAVNNDGSKTNKIVKITNIDKTIPEGSCQVTEYPDKLIYNVKITSFNYIIGYNYINGTKETGYVSNSGYILEEKSNGNLSVSVIDYIGNTNTFNCVIGEKKSSLEPFGYNNKVINGMPRLHIPIGEALAKKGYTINDLNMCIYKRVQEAGPYTRWGVTAAAYGLIECTYTMTGYVLPYNHTSGKVSGDNCSFNSDICGKLGINSKWGSPGGICNPSQPQCWHGLNCATFVRWAMCNGGMDLCSKGSAGAFSMVNKNYFPEADGVYIKSGEVKYYSGENLTKYSPEQLVRRIKPGDAMASSEGEGHAFMVVGYDQKGIYTAEDGYFMRYIKYDTIINSGISYLILYLDKYYANPNNYNHLYG